MPGIDDWIIILLFGALGVAVLASGLGLTSEGFKSYLREWNLKRMDQNHEKWLTTKNNDAATTQKIIETQAATIQELSRSQASMFESLSRQQSKLFETMSNQNIALFREYGQLTGQQLQFLRDVLSLALTAREQEEVRKYEGLQAGYDREHELDKIRLQAEVLTDATSFDELKRDLEEAQSLVKQSVGSDKLDSRQTNQITSMMMEKIRNRRRR